MSLNNVPSDGSCLLHSIALAFLDSSNSISEFEPRFVALFGTGYENECKSLYYQFSYRITSEPIWKTLILKFRLSLVEFMEKQSSIFKNPVIPHRYIENNENFYKTQSFTEYLQYISFSHVWLGSLEIWAASLMLDCCIAVQQKNEIIATFNRQSSIILTLEFLKEDKHYNSILKCSPISKQKRNLDQTEFNEISDSSDLDDVPQVKILKLDEAIQPSKSARLKRALHGIVYQLELLMLFLLRSKKLTDIFFLTTEMNLAEKFDDVVLKYKMTGDTKYKWRFLQAKHKQDPTKHKIAIKELMSSNDANFSLQKYYVSFYKIKTNEYFEDAELEDFCILTNTTFDSIKNEEDSNWTKLYSKVGNLQNDPILFFGGQKHEEIKFKTDPPQLEELSNTIKSALQLAITSDSKKRNQNIQLLQNSAMIPVKIKDEIKSDDFSDSILETILIIEEKLNTFDEHTSRAQFFKLVDEIDNILEQNVAPKFNITKQELKKKKRIKFPEKKEFLTERVTDLNNYLKSKTDKKYFLQVTSNGDDKTKIKDLKEALENFDTYFPKFILKLRFITDYPNLDNLSSLISKEIGTDENLLTPDLFTHSFKNDMLDWFKERDSKGLSKFRSNKILDEIQYKINTLKVAGLSRAYPEELNNYSINFNHTLNVLKFLKNDQVPILHLISTKPLLTSIKLLKTLNEVGTREEFHWLNREDSFIFIKLDLMLLSGIQDIAIKSFSSDLDSHNLLIIECVSSIKEELKYIKLFNKLKEQIQAISNKKRKRKEKMIGNNKSIILIGAEDDCFIKQFKTFPNNQMKDISYFSNLNEMSQERILSRQLKLQGKDILLGDIFDNMKPDQLIDESFLVSSLLIENEPIEIGEILKPHLNYNHDYYILRKLQFQKMKKNILSSGMYLFVSNITEDQLVKLRVKRDNLCKFEDYEVTFKNIIFTESDDLVETQSYFEEVCCKEIHQSIHWIIFNAGYLEWKSSRGNVNSILEYIDNECPSIFNNYLFEEDGREYIVNRETCSYTFKWFSLEEDVDQNYCPVRSEISFEEDDVLGFKIPEKLVIIADNSGMGKSSLLASVSLKIKDNNPHWWVSVINLHDFTDESKYQCLQNINFNDGDLCAAVDYCSLLVLHPDIERFENKFIQKLFKESLLSDHSSQKLNIVLLFDGFDEIAPAYQTKTVKLLKCLRETKIKQLWITTRLQLKTFLESKLNFPALVLNQFTNDDKIEFLNKFLKWHLKYREQNLEVALHTLATVQNTQSLYETKFVKDILELLKAMRSKCSIEYIHYSIQHLDPSEYSSFLLLKWQKAAMPRKEDITSNPLYLRMLADVTFKRIQNLNDNFNILTLYQSFVTGTLEVFFRDKNTLGKGLGGRELEIPLTMYYKNIHQKLALDFLKTLVNNKVAEYSSFGMEEGQSSLRIGLLLYNSNFKPTFIHATIAEYFVFEWLVSNHHKEKEQELIVNKILIHRHNRLILDFFELHLSNTIEQPNQKINHTKLFVSEKFFHTISQEDPYQLSVLHGAAVSDHPNILKYLIGHFKKYDLKYLKNTLMKTGTSGGTVLFEAYTKKNATCFKILLDLYGLYCEESFYFYELVKILEKYFLYVNIEEPENDAIIVRDLISFAKLKLCEKNFKRLLLTPIPHYNYKNSISCGCFWTIIHVMVYFKQEAILKILFTQLQEYPFILRKLLLETRTCKDFLTPFDLALYKNYSNIVTIFVTRLQTNSKLLTAMILQSNDKYGNTLQNIELLQNPKTIKFYLEIISKYLNPADYKRVINLLVLSCNHQKETTFSILFNIQNDIAKEVLVTLLNKLELQEIIEDILLISMYSTDLTAERQYTFLDWFKNCVMETVHANNTSISETIKNVEENIPTVLEKIFSLFQKIRSSTLDTKCQILKNKELLLFFNLDQFISNCEVKIQEVVLIYLRDYPNILRTIVSEVDGSRCTILHRLIMRSNTEEIKTFLTNIRLFSDITENLIVKSNENEETAAHVAVQSGNKEILELLLGIASIEKYMLIDLIFATNKRKRNILELAIEKKDESIVKLILSFVDRLEIGYKIDLIFAAYKHTENVIFFCLKKSNREICTLLFEYIINNLESSKCKELFLDSNNIPTVAGADDGNLIFAAAQQTEYLVVDILLKYIRIVFNNQEYKTYILSTNSKQQNFLHIACGLGSILNIRCFVKELLEFSNLETVVSLLLAQDNQLKMTPLHNAVIYKNYDSLQCILFYPYFAQDFIRDLLFTVGRSGCTLLTLTAKTDSVDCFVVVLAKAQLMENEQPGIINELLSKTDMIGRTVLHHIIIRKQTCMLDLLLGLLTGSVRILDQLILNVDINGDTILHHYVAEKNLGVFFTLDTLATEQYFLDEVRLRVYNDPIIARAFVEFLSTVSNDRTSLRTPVADDKLSDMKKVFTNLEDPATISQILKMENKFGVTPLHKAYWNWNSKNLLEEDIYVQFLVKEMTSQNLDNRIYANLQIASNIAQRFEDAIESENLHEIKCVLSECQDCIKELFLMPAKSYRSFLRAAYMTKNIDIVKIILQYLNNDSNLLKYIFLSNPILDYNTVGDFELFSLVLEYAKNIEDEKFFRHIILEDELITTFIFTDGNKNIQELIKKEMNVIAQSLVSPEGESILESLECRELEHLNGYVTSNIYTGSFQDELVNIITKEKLRRDNLPIAHFLNFVRTHDHPRAYNVLNGILLQQTNKNIYFLQACFVALKQLLLLCIKIT